MSKATESLIMSAGHSEPAKGVGWRIAAALAAGIAAGLITTLATGQAHAAAPPQRLTLQCIRWYSGRLSVQDSHHLMRGTRPYRVVYKLFGPPLYGGTFALGSCLLQREG